MKRLFKAALIGLTALSLGCTKFSGSYEDELNRRVERAVTCRVAQPNYAHDVYSYYREPSVGRISSDVTSNTFLMDGVKFVMNLRVSSIINQKYYADAPDSSTLMNMEQIAESTGTFLDYTGSEHPFRVTLYQLAEQIYVYTVTDQVEFFAIASGLQALQTAETMVRMARSVRVDNDAVIAEYSGRQTIDYSRKRLELFQNIVPENGVIEELFEGYGSYAGQADGEYFGDNYTDDTVGNEDLDFSQGDEQLDGYDAAASGTESAPDAENAAPEENWGDAGDTEETLPPETE
jgi:hypothetical protein